MALTPVITLVGFFMAAGWRRWSTWKCRSPVFPRSWRASPIAQITDLHCGARRSSAISSKRSVDRVSPERGHDRDTGDVADGSVPDLAHHTERSRGSPPATGPTSSPATTKYYSGVHAWIRELERLGARVLMNEHVVLDHDGAGADGGGRHGTGPPTISIPRTRAILTRRRTARPSTRPRSCSPHQPRSAPFAKPPATSCSSPGTRTAAVLAVEFSGAPAAAVHRGAPPPRRLWGLH